MITLETVLATLWADPCHTQRQVWADWFDEHDLADIAVALRTGPATDCGHAYPLAPLYQSGAGFASGDGSGDRAGSAFGDGRGYGLESGMGDGSGHGYENGWGFGYGRKDISEAAILAHGLGIAFPSGEDPAGGRGDGSEYRPGDRWRAGEGWAEGDGNGHGYGMGSGFAYGDGTDYGLGNSFGYGHGGRGREEIIPRHYAHRLHMTLGDAVLIKTSGPGYAFIGRIVKVLPPFGLVLERPTAVCHTHCGFTEAIYRGVDTHRAASYRRFDGHLTLPHVVSSVAWKHEIPEASLPSMVSRETMEGRG